MNLFFRFRSAKFGLSKTPSPPLIPKIAFHPIQSLPIPILLFSSSSSLSSFAHPFSHIFCCPLEKVNSLRKMPQLQPIFSFVHYYANFLPLNILRRKNGEFEWTLPPPARSITDRYRSQCVRSLLLEIFFPPPRMNNWTSP